MQGSVPPVSPWIDRSPVPSLIGKGPNPVKPHFGSAKGPFLPQYKDETVCHKRLDFSFYLV